MKEFEKTLHYTRRKRKKERTASWAISVNSHFLYLLFYTETYACACIHTHTHAIHKKKHLPHEPCLSPLINRKAGTNTCAPCAMSVKSEEMIGCSPLSYSYRNPCRCMQINTMMMKVTWSLKWKMNNIRVNMIIATVDTPVK